jgi:hypothetical protein
VEAPVVDPLNSRVRASIEAQMWSIRDDFFMFSFLLCPDCRFLFPQGCCRETCDNERTMPGGVVVFSSNKSESPDLSRLSLGTLQIFSLARSLCPNLLQNGVSGSDPAADDTLGQTA